MSYPLTLVLNITTGILFSKYVSLSYLIIKKTKNNISNENITIIILFSNPALIIVNDKSLGIPVILHIDDALQN